MKKLIMLPLVLGFLVGGCATVNETAKGWVKDGSTAEQLKKDYQECRGPLYTKPGMDIKEYEKDLLFCEDASWARYRRGIALSSIPVAGGIVRMSSKDLCERCMKSKDYEKNSPMSNENVNKCMQEKGYEWK